MRHGTLDRSRIFCGLLCAAALLMATSGCAMCCAPYDGDFGYTGGAWVRDNPSYGRVGSAFEPAGYKVLVEEVDPNSGQPTAADPNQEPAIQNLDPQNPGPDAVDPMPMPMQNQPPGAISVPRMRPVRNYLPQN